jgi:hypothetical protein
MHRYGALFALMVVFMGLAFVPSASADADFEWETTTHYSHVRSITWSGDSQYIAVTSFDDDENEMRHSVAEMWDSSLENHRVFGTDDAQPISAALNDDGSRLFTGLSTGEVALWDTESSALLQRMPAHKTAPELEISDDRKWLVSWDEDSAIIWDANTLERHFLITRPSQARESVDFVFAAISPDNQILALGHSAGVVLFYDLKSKTHISGLVTGEHGKPYGAFYSDDGELVLGYKPSTLKLCAPLATQCYDVDLDAGIYYVTEGYQNDDDVIVATNDGTVETRNVYNYPDMTLYPLKRNLYNVSELVLSPDEYSIAVGAYSGRLIVAYTTKNLELF